MGSAYPQSADFPIAAFPMYDFPELQADNDRLWTRLAQDLSAAGIPDVPPALTRTLSHTELWRHPNLLLAQACEYPIATELAGFVKLVATPRYSAPGCTDAQYRSAIVIRRYEAARILMDMRGRRCAVNELSSNSGMNLLRAAVAPLADGGHFFQEIAISGSHRRSVEMVADGEADLAAIDCVTLAHLREFAPQHVAALKILCWTEQSPSLPLVTAAETDERTVRALRAALANLIDDPDLDEVRDRLFLEDFDFAPDETFTRALGLAQHATELSYPSLV